MASRFWAGLALLLIGCGPQVAIDDDPDATETGGAPGEPATSGATFTSSGPPPATTGMGPTTSPPDTSADSTDEGSADSGSFIGIDTDSCGVEPPEGTTLHCSIVECNPFDQSGCPDGEKCMPWANDGGEQWNAYRCTAIAADPGQAGDACEVEGNGASGVDDCDLGLMCFWVDPDTLQGTCVPLCGGSPEAPTCPGDGYCTISASSALTLCLDTCDPLADDCAIGACFPTNDAFVCQGVVPGELTPGDACDFPQACAVGSTCISGRFVEGCDGVGCCASYCDLTAAEPDAPCMPGQSCLPWWERGRAPEPWAHVGVCAVPQ